MPYSAFTAGSDSLFRESLCPQTEIVAIGAVFHSFSVKNPRNIWRHGFQERYTDVIRQLSRPKRSPFLEGRLASGRTKTQLYRHLRETLQTDNRSRPAVL